MNTSYFHKDFECLFDLFRCHLKADRNCCANVTAIIRNFNVYDSTLITVFFFDWSESNVTEWMVIDDCWMISGRYQSYKTSMIGDWIRDQSHESSIEIECYAINAIKVFPHCFQLRQFLFVWEIYDQSEKKTASNQVEESKGYRVYPQMESIFKWRKILECRLCQVRITSEQCNRTRFHGIFWIPRKNKIFIFQPDAVKYCKSLTMILSF